MIKSSIALVSILLSAFAVFAAEGVQSPPLQHQGAGWTEPVHSQHASDHVAWIEIAYSGQQFGRAGGGVIGEYYYLFGYIDYPRAQAVNWRTEHWEMSTPPPLGNCNYSGVTTSANIYLIGRYCDYRISGETQKFTPNVHGSRGTWSMAANYPLAVCGIAADWDGDNYIYAAGGSNLTTAYANAYKYDIAADAWTEIAPLPQPMEYHGGAFVEGDFHVMGGVQNPSNAHFAYDPLTDTWSSRSPMPIPNYFAAFSLASNDGYIFSIGGGGGYHIWPATDAVQVYDPLADVWTQETPLPRAFGLNSAASAPGGIVISAGGYDSIYINRAFKGEGFPTGGFNSDIGKGNIKPYPLEFTLFRAYPNPFNPSVNFEFTSPLPGAVSIIISDSRGREVERALYESGLAGVNRITFNAAGLSSGIYFARLSQNGFSHTQKLILIR